MKKKHMAFILSLMLCMGCITACGGNDMEEVTDGKTIVCTDFTSFDITRRITEGTDITVEGVDFGAIDWEKGISGRDRAKINRSMLFINGTWVDAATIGIDESTQRIELSGFMEKKQNSKDDNRIYSGISIDLKDGNEINDTENDGQSGNRNPVVVIPGAGKEDDPDGNNPADADEENNNDADVGANGGNITGNNGQGSGQGGIPDNNDNNGNIKGNETGNPSSVGNNGQGGNGQAAQGNGGAIVTPNPSESQEKLGLRMYFLDSTYDAPPTSSDRNGYALGSYPEGAQVAKPSVNPDPYQTWICDRIASMDSGSCLYFILGNGNGTYTIFYAEGMLIPRYKVVATVDDIRISTITGTTDVACESGTKDMLSAYSSCFMEGKPPKIAQAERSHMLADTVDFAQGIWLDVGNTRELALKIKDRLIEADPINKEKFEENYKKLDSELASMDDKFQFAVESSRNRTIFIGGAFVYKYMTDAYGIDYVSIYDYSIQEDTVSPTRLMNFADLLSTYKIKYIVKDCQSSMDGINSVKSEIDHNLNTLIIDTLYHVDDWGNTSYIDMMDDNCTILKKALY